MGSNDLLFCKQNYTIPVGYSKDYIYLLFTMVSLAICLLDIIMYKTIMDVYLHLLYFFCQLSNIHVCIHSHITYKLLPDVL